MGRPGLFNWCLINKSLLIFFTFVHKKKFLVIFNLCSNEMLSLSGENKDDSIICKTLVMKSQSFNRTVIITLQKRNHFTEASAIKLAAL